VSLSISNALLYEKLQILSITDGLTGLYDHQGMLRFLNNELEKPWPVIEELAKQVEMRSTKIIRLEKVDHFY